MGACFRNETEGACQRSLFKIFCGWITIFCMTAFSWLLWLKNWGTTKGESKEKPANASSFKSCLGGGGVGRFRVRVTVRVRFRVRVRVRNATRRNFTVLRLNVATSKSTKELTHNYKHELTCTGTNTQLLTAITSTWILGCQRAEILVCSRYTPLVPPTWIDTGQKWAYHKRYDSPLGETHCLQTYRAHSTWLAAEGHL